jgi:UDP-N-acetylmuramyl pentapeptide phosphotransferase/UDP-N-acetylglucosamine-1-phosphate transferase
MTPDRVLWLDVFAAAACALPVTLWLIGRVRRILIEHQVLDRPGARSSHAAPTPRGAGLAVVPIALAAWLALAYLGPLDPPPWFWLVPLGAGAIVLISWIDDRRGGLSPFLRLAFHGAAVTAGLFALPGERLVFGGALPGALDWALSAALWLWFVNLFNFMDGIDGLAGIETVTLGLGLFLLTLILPALGPQGAFGLVLMAGGLGFLVWNWPPARIFLGDVGSVPLGYLLGYLLLGAAAKGAWPAALILPGYFLADATLTLIRRLRAGQPIWRAHREHFYQRAVQGGFSHRHTTLSVALLNAGLIGLALLSSLGPGLRYAALALAAALIGALLWYFGRVFRKAPHAG